RQHECHSKGRQPFGRRRHSSPACPAYPWSLASGRETRQSETHPMAEAFICDFARTPIGRYAGVLKDIRTDDLAAHPLRVLRERNASVDWAALDDCYMGCANQAGEDNRNVARMATLLAGYPV